MPQAPYPAPPRSIEEAARDPEWIAHRYDPEHDAVHLLPVPRAAQRKATFLTDEYLPAGPAPLVVRRRDAIAALPSSAPVHFVFHSAFCCSTLVANAFDLPGRSMGLKEPVVLNDMIGWRRRGGQGPDMAEVLDDMLRLLARPFSANESVVVKPSNAINALIAPILTLRPQSHALLLHAPLRTYLGSIARKGLDGRLWVRTLLLGLLDDRLVDLGFSPRDHLGQTDLQVAAIGWLAQHALFARTVQTFGPGRVRTLDSARLMADPAIAMGALGRHFGLPLSDRELAEIVSGPAFTSHSKLGTAFGAAERASEGEAGVALHADEIDKVIAWTQAVADTAGISMAAPAPLIEDRTT
ncbi:hypothetical protein [Sphingomonas sp.]|uniref:hypothetical protein n=1 Tax=Sphingomonas sp. TaxID=28214 RepID=UPI000DB6869E|nr:hypothetical protein [Sphingomonas sp.]PZU07513.1 MAG: hypothetical protein DI605_15765 [Sphingomonas sp.]